MPSPSRQPGLGFGQEVCRSRWPSSTLASTLPAGLSPQGSWRGELEETERPREVNGLV